MKKSTYIQLIIGTIGGLLFALGMCMCLLPEWNAFQLGLVCTAAGAIILLVQVMSAWLRSGKKLHINWTIVCRVCYGILGALVLGLGMCMIMVWKLMIPGIVVGVVGVFLLLSLIPICLGLKS